MDFANQIILVSAGLITFSIFAGVLSSRIGAPLLLVFLAFGMLAGEDGPGGIVFDDFSVAYLVGSFALALILFDGGLRTHRDALNRAFGPSLALATIGVVLTAGITGLAAKYLFDLDWAAAFLLGAIVGSTDAAAVFFLLHLRGLRLKARVAATLEVESGINDPMAIFLTLALVGFATASHSIAGWEDVLTFALDFFWQMLGGVLFGVAGGALVLRAVNRLQLSSGLYPILAGALGLLVFALAQGVNASGFLAVYIVGFTIGNNPHRATSEISRFSDGVAWLSQICMFLMMGLLVTPSALLPLFFPALAVALTLILVARPAAVWLCLAPFRFSPKETAFVSWVGLRGAVPIFLGTIPVLSGVEGAETLFSIAYVIVLVSLILQGWTIPLAARAADVELPPRPAPDRRVELDLPAGKGKSVVAYTVDPMSLLLRRGIGRLPLPVGATVISVMREGVVRTEGLDQGVKPGDVVMILTTAGMIPTLDRLFGARRARTRAKDAGTVDFILEGSASAALVADLYGLDFEPEERALTLEEFMRSRLGREVKEGARTRVAGVALAALQVQDGVVRQVGLDLDPPQEEKFVTRLRTRARDALRSLRVLFIADDPRGPF
ncbi:MAG: potassium/proton antiporter [Parvibaculum sp.]|uniref:potassium/proton antiporter n=1 Tax=Parvibaculum sp. TaxID=2024848 RepID=UPI002AB8DD09|nr:potassium/proton antiporter [Parvibaculum sp.]MDZ4380640.1 potassium/proton antiporter [Parvibaculum sp.]